MTVIEGFKGRSQTVQRPTRLVDPVDHFARLNQKTLALLQRIRLIAPPADVRSFEDGRELNGQTPEFRPPLLEFPAGFLVVGFELAAS